MPGIKAIHLRDHSPYNDMVHSLCNRISPFGKDKFFKKFLFSPARWLLYVSLLVAVLGLSASGVLHAASTPSGPQALVLPWQLIGWDGEFPVRHRTLLEDLHQRLQADWLRDAQTLDRWVSSQGRSQSLNSQRRSQTIWIGTPRMELGFDAYVVPVICPVADQLVFGLQLVDLRSQLIIAGTTRMTPRAPWDALNRPQSMAEPFYVQLQEMLQDLVVAGSRQRQETPTDAMKLSLRLLRGSDSSRTGAHQCLSMILAHSLLDQQRVLASIGALEVAHIHDVMQLPESPQRFTRALGLDWGRYPEGPERFSVDARWVEGILGGSIAPHIETTLTLRHGPDRFELSPILSALLRDAKESLKLADLPQISRIYKAWVYLDRGRAYGLEMDDRLYFDDGQRLIKGHVVGFYGPRLGVISPRGFPVQEGAIVFIRKGQRQTKIGDTLRFDPKTFPTPWPPPSPDKPSR